MNITLFCRGEDMLNTQDHQEDLHKYKALNTLASHILLLMMMLLIRTTAMIMASGRLCLSDLTFVAIQCSAILPWTCVCFTILDLDLEPDKSLLDYYWFLSILCILMSGLTLFYIPSTGMRFQGWCCASVYYFYLKLFVAGNLPMRKGLGLIGGLHRVGEH